VHFRTGTSSCPTLQSGDVSGHLVRLWNGLIDCGSLIVAAHESRRLCHPVINGLHVYLFDVRHLPKWQSVDSPAKALDRSVQQDFFYGAFPCFSEQTIYIPGMRFVCFLPDLREDRPSKLQSTLEHADSLPNVSRRPRKPVTTDTGSLVVTLQTVVCQADLVSLALFRKIEKEDYIVCEHNHLSGACLLDQAFGNVTTPLVIQRADRVVKN